jgi:hypothetical protein
MKRVYRLKVYDERKEEKKMIMEKEFGLVFGRRR